MGLLAEALSLPLAVMIRASTCTGQKFFFARGRLLPFHSLYKL
jgi:hypothetical protein